VEGVTGLEMLAERVSAGGLVTAADAEIVLQSRDLIAIGSMADAVRRRLHGPRTTFLRVLEIHVDAPPASFPTSMAAGEIRIVGAPTSLDHAIAVVSAAARLAGNVPVIGFSLLDLTKLGAPLGDVAARLHGAGLYGISEIAVDESPDAKAIAEVREGRLMAERLTVHTYADVSAVTMLQRAADLQKSAGGFRCFAPLPRVVSPLTPTTGYDDVRLVALARLMASEIPSIQVDWPLYGPKLAQVALTMGADDVDGVAAFDPAVLGHRRSALAEVTGNIRAAALEPVERTGRFEHGA
jgi:hypothetical protein